MGPTRRHSPDPIRASGFACPAQPICPPLHLAAAAVFSSRHPRPHSFAPHHAMSGDGYANRPIQELLGHRDAKMTVIYSRALNQGGPGIRRPMDAL